MAVEPKRPTFTMDQICTLDFLVEAVTQLIEWDLAHDRGRLRDLILRIPGEKLVKYIEGERVDLPKS